MPIHTLTLIAAACSSSASSLSLMALIAAGCSAIPQASLIASLITSLITEPEPRHRTKNELNYRSEYVSCVVKVGESNYKLIALYDDALSNLDHRKEVPYLDCSCPRVYARGNNTDKAVAVQDLYQQKGIELALLTVSG
jgi:hypothetical protein